jgi:ABC-2 type transport system permease protein
MRSVQAGFVLMARELGRLVRDPAAVLSILVAPLLLALIAGVSLGAPVRLDATIAIAGIPPAQLASASTSAGSSLHVVAIAPGAAEEAVRSGKASAAIVVPSDLSQPVRVVTDQHQKIAADVATSIARTIEARRSSAITTSTADPNVVVVASTGRRALHGIEIYGPVAAVFFVLFGVGFVSRSLHLERVNGTLARILVSPIHPSVVLATKILIMFIVGIVEITLVIFGTTVFFGARWGNPFEVALVVFAIVCAGVAIAIAIAGVTSSPSQSQAIEFAVSMLLVAIGGHMVPLQNLPDVLGHIAHYTPNGAAIDAFGNIASGSPFAQALSSELVVIAVFTALVAVVGALRFRRAVAA